jgi:hypothetical protein
MKKAIKSLLRLDYEMSLLEEFCPTLLMIKNIDHKNYRNIFLVNLQ